MIPELDCYTQNKYPNWKSFKSWQKISSEKPEMYQTSLRGGGGVPPLWQNTKPFQFFSFEGFPNSEMNILAHHNGYSEHFWIPPLLVLLPPNCLSSQDYSLQFNSPFKKKSLFLTVFSLVLLQFSCLLMYLSMLMTF